VPAGSVDVVICSGVAVAEELVFALTAIDREVVAVWGDAAESFAETVNEDWPLAVGVPLIVPLLDKVRPAGKDPDARLQV
jgi:hypothetical protein